MEMNKELKKELENPENYKKHFKDKCVMCGCNIPATWEHYKVSGNYCGKCNSICEKNAKFKRRENKLLREKLSA